MTFFCLQTWQPTKSNCGRYENTRHAYGDHPTNSGSVIIPRSACWLESRDVIGWGRSCKSTQVPNHLACLPQNICRKIKKNFKHFYICTDIILHTIIWYYWFVFQNQTQFFMKLLFVLCPIYAFQHFLLISLSSFLKC